MPSFCVVSNCEYKYTHTESVSFHKFPLQNPTLLAKWLKFVGRSEGWKPSRWSSVCSRHFLPRDFRGFLLRKCLKKDAVPSVTIQEFGADMLDWRAHRKQHQISPDEILNTNCRMCGLPCTSKTSFFTNFEVFGMIQKCFPTLNIQQDDNLPKNLCSQCLQRLKNFSEFVDDVLRTQNELQMKFTREPNNLPTVNPDRQLQIKQEPIVRVKQEKNENVRSVFSDNFDNAILDDECQFEQKSELFQLPLFNSQDIVNNCEIMEVVSLDDAFIDIPDDEAADDLNEHKVKLTFTQIFKYAMEDHNYTRLSELDEFRNYKTEAPEEIENKQIEPVNLNSDLSISELTFTDSIAEQIIKPLPCMDRMSCDKDNNEPVTVADNKQQEQEKLVPKKSIYNCAECKLLFTCMSEKLMHKNKFHRAKTKFKTIGKYNLPCELCGKYMLSKLALNNHRKYICEVKGKQEFQCKYCTKNFMKWKMLRKHECGCKKIEKEVAIKNKLVKRRRYPKRKRDETGRYTCSQCGRSYTRLQNLLAHEARHRPRDQWNFKCGNCGTDFDYLYDLRRHLKNNICVKAPYTNGPISFVCTLCGKQFKGLQMLKMHVTAHSGKKPYVCETCGSAFHFFNNLHQHRTTHTDERPHHCNMCDKAYKRRSGLNQHKKAFHLKLKPHQCDVCNHSYALKADMVRCRHSYLKAKYSNIQINAVVKQ